MAVVDFIPPDGLPVEGPLQVGGMAGPNKAGQTATPISMDALKERSIHLEEDPDEVVRLWGDRLSTVRGQFALMRAHMYRNLLAYNGYVLFDVDEDSNRVEQVGLPAWFPENLQLEPNHLRRITHSIASQIRDLSAVLRVRPRTPSIRDRRIADVSDRLIRNLLESRDMARWRTHLSIALPLFGTMVGRVAWDETKWDTVLLPDGSRYRGQVGGLSVELVPACDVLYPLGNGFNDPRRLPWVIHRRRVTFEELKRMYPDDWTYLADLDTADYGVDDAGWHWADMANDPNYDLGLWGAPLDGVFGGPRQEETWIVDECYERCYDPEIGPYVHRTVICNGYLLDSAPYLPTDGDGNPLMNPDGTVRTWDIPYRWVQYYTNPSALIGHSMMRDALPIVWCLAWMYSVWMKVSADSANKMVAVHLLDGHTPEYKHGQFYLKYAEKPPQPINFTGTPPSIGEAIGLLEKLLHDITMQPEVLLGASSPYQSADAAQAQGAAARSAFSGVRANVNEFWADMSALALTYMRDMYVLPRLVGAVPDLAESMAHFRDSDISPDDVTLNYEEYWNMTPDGREQIALRRLQSGVWDAATARRFLRSAPFDGGVELEELQERAADDIIRRIVDMPDEEADALYAEIAQAVEQVQQQVEQAAAQAGAEGRQPPQFDAVEFMSSILEERGIGVAGYHDIAVHQQRTMTFQLQPQYEELTEAKKFFIEQRRVICAARMQASMVEQAQLATIQNHGVGQ